MVKAATKNQKYNRYTIRYTIIENNFTNLQKINILRI
jgi:hypothetical protein